MSDNPIFRPGLCTCINVQIKPWFLPCSAQSWTELPRMSGDSNNVHFWALDSLWSLSCHLIAQADNDKMQATNETCTLTMNIIVIFSRLFSKIINYSEHCKNILKFFPYL